MAYNEANTAKIAPLSTTYLEPMGIYSSDVTQGINPLTVNFTNQSTGALNYNWNFGPFGTSTLTNPTQVFYVWGTYTVTLIASSGSCSDTASMVIIVDEGLSIEIPNVFTPNNDGVNDVFTIKSSGVKEISLQIFNRWGQKMYEFTGAKAAWDGMRVLVMKLQRVLISTSSKQQALMIK